MKKSISKQEIAEENAKQLIIMFENFKLLRQKKGCSVKELSELSGISEKILAGMEAGENFGVQYLFQLCHIYRIKPCEIFSRII